jgi:hypothetical protein
LLRAKGPRNSITFNTDRTVSDTSSQDLTKQALARNVLAPDGAPTGVRVNTGGHHVSATVSPEGEVVVTDQPRANSINMGSIPNGEAGLLASAKRAGTPVAAADLRPTDLITVPGFGEVQVQVAERIGLLSADPATGRTTNATAGSLREASGEAEQERQAAAPAAAQAADRERASLNAHPVPEIEDAHASFTTKVSTSDQIGALVQLQNTGKLNDALLHRVAEAMGVQPDAAVDQLSAMSLGVQAQFKVMASSRGVDPDQAAEWIRTHRSQHVMSALQRHALGRDVVGAWSGLLADYARATQGAKSR